ncbi:hypothetical protein CRE_17998 [Caenorhabditis remanei]|uniref:Uncharacterized protein n=1 Tax=Caenorhabditis remanei TaxID=31234 RepID=E3MTQ3_CAERE|nr:hypothetical protein CRE_17998 [Caenorhabditis remanei]
MALLISLLCGIWCLLAAKNVRQDGTLIILDDDEHDRSKGSRSTAGSEFSAIDMEEDEKGGNGGVKEYLKGIGRSLIFMKK